MDTQDSDRVHTDYITSYIFIHTGVGEHRASPRHAQVNCINF